jgi:serine/threonine-protein kinase CTR1
VHAGTWREKKVAVKKVLLPEGMSQAQQRRLVEDFKCEVDICCRLTHPRLVDFLGYTTAPDLCIVQELMEQGSLYDQFRRGWRAKSLEQQLVLAHDIARGMAYLHAWRPPLIHRDLKSLNILVSANQPSGDSSRGLAAPLARCKVTDFGMTRAKAMGQPTEAEAMAGGASPAEVMTLAMTRCGTPFWTAPEIIQGGTYNESVDQYAFGCVCLEILTGSPPWQTAPIAGRRGGGGTSEQMAPIKVMQV